MRKVYRILQIAAMVCLALPARAQRQYELNTGWKCIKASAIAKPGGEISLPSFPLTGWMAATVPGTILTTLLNNKQIPDPFFGRNNAQIPDIYSTGRDYYTYWFIKDFTEKPAAKEDKVWLEMRGVNNSCDVYVNGHHVNTSPDKSMYLRHTYDITALLARDGRNRLAVVVYPPDSVGNPNGGQGGDGIIAHSITNQYTAGWDWIQPVHDRNTGIWDKVFIRKTGPVTVSHAHIVTRVPSIRKTTGPQQTAIIQVTAELENTTQHEIAGILQYDLDSNKVSLPVTLPPGSKQMFSLPDLPLKDPVLWWPNGLGRQYLYTASIQFITGKAVSGEEQIKFGIRELTTVWNTATNSREIQVNGQRLFIKGGNRILSDAMLRLSPERYDAEMRYHRDMNLNLIRVWGGGITERPEFYDACDKYGLLVMQDFWISGDCNGRWYDPLKAEDTNARRAYPDDHRLFITSLEDNIKMLRNHPSLALWCGGNEIRPPKDILKALRDTLLPQLDNTRYFFGFSNDDSMSYHSGDGPYTLQTTNYFWEHRSFPFNSEIGSVGIGDYESLERFLPKESMVQPWYDTTERKWKADSMWTYHKYCSYDSSVEVYGHPTNARDFAAKAQLVNYEQYRALMEGFTAHMWEWYTGVIIWKTQNPWTAMVGQMYDVYLDPNACLYGLREGAKPIHIMYDPLNRSVRIANTTNETRSKIRMVARAYLPNGTASDIVGRYVQLPAQTCDEYHEFKNSLRLLKQYDGVFLYLALADSMDNTIDENLYWMPDGKGKYTGIIEMPRAEVGLQAVTVEKGKVEVTISNPFGGPVAFFNHLALINTATGKRILSVFCNNNYISVLPGQQQVVLMEYIPEVGVIPAVTVEGWNVAKQTIVIKKLTR